jgi:hypothetical protein
MTRVVKVWDGDEPNEITLIKKSKTVWIAVGQYMGKEVRAQGRTANNPAALWAARLTTEATRHAKYCAYGDDVALSRVIELT